MFRSAVGPRSGRQLDNKESIASRARPKPSKRHPRTRRCGKGSVCNERREGGEWALITSPHAAASPSPGQSISKGEARTAANRQDKGLEPWTVDRGIRNRAREGVSACVWTLLPPSVGCLESTRQTRISGLACKAGMYMYSQLARHVRSLQSEYL